MNTIKDQALFWSRAQGAPNFFWVLNESLVFVFKITLHVANKQKPPYLVGGFVCLALLGLISFLCKEVFPSLTLQL